MQGLADRFGQGGDVSLSRSVHGTSRDVTEILGDQFAGFGFVDIARQDQDRVVRAIVVDEPLAHRLHAGGIQVSHRADGRVTIGVTFGEQGFQRGIIGQAIGLVVALALFVLDNTALQIQHLLAHLAQQVPHAVRFQVKGIFQRRGRHGLEVVGTVKPGGAVQSRRASGIQGLDVRMRAVFRTAEHQVLEQVGKAGRALGLIL